MQTKNQDMVFWTEPITISSMPRFPMGLALRFEKNEYGLDGAGAHPGHAALKVGDKIRCFVSFGHIVEIRKVEGA